MPPPAIEQPVHCQPLDAGRWRIGNGLLELTAGPQGVLQLCDGSGRDYLAGPLELCRYRDVGEFWDAWDLPADYPDHPLPIRWEPEPQWLQQGPLCVALCWRAQLGQSRLRLEARLLAGTPWLELLVSIDWQQRHELLRLQAPLAQQVQRWAADTSGGVLERPGTALNAREQARWEVAAISWMAAEAAAPGGGLGVLLDGPQGVSASAERLGVSLLRGPTWPDPGADNGWQRQRLALMPCPKGWLAADLPLQAIAFREPLWLRPWPAATGQSGVCCPGLPPLGPGLQLLSLRPEADEQSALLALQNQTPCRRRIDLGQGCQLQQRLDGLDQPLAQSNQPIDLLGPWQCGFWRIRRR